MGCLPSKKEKKKARERERETKAEEEEKGETKEVVKAELVLKQTESDVETGKGGQRLEEEPQSSPKGLTSMEKTIDVELSIGDAEKVKEAKERRVDGEEASESKQNDAVLTDMKEINSESAPIQAPSPTLPVEEDEKLVSEKQEEQGKEALEEEAIPNKEAVEVPSISVPKEQTVEAISVEPPVAEQRTDPEIRMTEAALERRGSDSSEEVVIKESAKLVRLSEPGQSLDQEKQTTPNDEDEVQGASIADEDACAESAEGMPSTIPLPELSPVGRVAKFGNKDTLPMKSPSVRELARRFTSAAENEKNKTQLNGKTAQEVKSEKEKRGRISELEDEIRGRQSSQTIKNYYETMEEIHENCETYRNF